MRSVLFRRYLGQRQWTDYNCPGTFHQWGLETEDTGETMVMRTIAIVELSDGSIENVLPNDLKFSDKVEGE